MTDTTDKIANAVATVVAFMRSHRCRTIAQAYDLPQFPVGALRQALPGYEYPEISGLTARQLRNRAIPRTHADRARRGFAGGTWGTTYVCKLCGKRTRDTGNSESSCNLCLACYDQCGLENEHSDGRHQDQPHPDCPDCQALAAAPAPVEPGIVSGNAAYNLLLDACDAEALEMYGAAPAPVEPAPMTKAESVAHEQALIEAMNEAERVAAEPTVPVAVLQQLADRLRRYAIQDLQSEQRWLQAAAEQPQRARDHQLVATHCCSRAEGYQRAAEEVDAVIALGCMK